MRSLYFVLLVGIGSSALAAPAVKTIWSFRGPSGAPASLASYGGKLYGSILTSASQTYVSALFELSPDASGRGWHESIIFEQKGTSAILAPVFDGGGNIYSAVIGPCSRFSECTTVFQAAPPSSPGAAWAYTAIYQFPFPTYGTFVYRGGALYAAITGDDGATNVGMIVEFTFSDGSWNSTVLYNFTGGSDGGGPEAILFDGAGNLYGTAGYGGVPNGLNPSGNGTVFELTPPAAPGGTWAENTLYAFDGQSDGMLPNTLSLAPSGTLYGTTIQGGGGQHSCSPGSGCGTLFQVSPPAQAGAAWTESTLYHFAGPATPGPADPTAILVSPQGDVYLSAAGGGSQSCPIYCGEILELMASGENSTLNPIHEFAGGADGQSPVALLLQANGALIVALDPGEPAGADGIVESFSPPATANGNWLQTTLYDFGIHADGNGPWPSFGFDAQGSVYGTTFSGGSVVCDVYDPSSCGAVYKLTPPRSPGKPWTETILHSFAGGADGQFPQSGIFVASDGSVYGTSAAGGAFSQGVAFELTPPSGSRKSWGETILHSFGAPGDGASPQGQLVADASGALYGTTQSGGSAGHGTVFQLTSPSAHGGAWSETVLWSFQGGGNGSLPGGLVFHNGSLFGVTYVGGQGGTVFQLSPPTSPGGTWTETIIHAFNGDNGANPISSLVFDENGGIYGATVHGGAGRCRLDVHRNCGVIFRLTPPNPQSPPGTAWSAEVLFDFSKPHDGNTATGIALWSGKLYASVCPALNGAGAILQFSPPASGHGSWQQSVVYHFGGIAQGNCPMGLAANQSAVYGTTFYGGAQLGSGTIFQFAP